MKAVNIYLTFDGNAREAMTFYSKCLDAQLEIMPFSAGPKEYVTPETENRLMHAQLSKGNVTIMASDTMPGMPLTIGTNFSININCESADEADRLFACLGAGGTVTMPLADAFWGAYFGMLRDRFGIQWMFNFERGRH